MALSREARNKIRKQQKKLGLRKGQKIRLIDPECTRAKPVQQNVSLGPNEKLKFKRNEKAKWIYEPTKKKNTINIGSKKRKLIAEAKAKGLDTSSLLYSQTDSLDKKVIDRKEKEKQKRIADRKAAAEELRSKIPLLKGSELTVRQNPKKKVTKVATKSKQIILTEKSPLLPTIKDVQSKRLDDLGAALSMKYEKSLLRKGKKIN